MLRGHRYLQAHSFTQQCPLSLMSGEHGLTPIYLRTVVLPLETNTIHDLKQGLWRNPQSCLHYVLYAAHYNVQIIF